MEDKLLLSALYYAGINIKYKVYCRYLLISFSFCSILSSVILKITC